MAAPSLASLPNEIMAQMVSYLSRSEAFAVALSCPDLLHRITRERHRLQVKEDPSYATTIESQGAMIRYLAACSFTPLPISSTRTSSDTITQFITTRAEDERVLSYFVHWLRRHHKYEDKIIVCALCWRYKRHPIKARTRLLDGHFKGKSMTLRPWTPRTDHRPDHILVQSFLGNVLDCGKMCSKHLAVVVTEEELHAWRLLEEAANHKAFTEELAWVTVDEQEPMTRIPKGNRNSDGTVGP